MTEPAGELTGSTDQPPTSEAESADQPPGRQAEPLTVPDAVQAVGPDLSGLCEARTAEDRAFLVDTGSLWIAGAESRPGFRVGMGRRVLAAVRVEGLGAVANVLLFPGVARRQSVGSRGTVLETLVSSPRLPLVVAQWARRDAGSDESGPTPEEIVVELAPPAAHAPSGATVSEHSPRGSAVLERSGSEDTASDAPDAEGRASVQRPLVRRHGDHVTVEASGHLTAVALSPAPRAVDAHPRTDGGVRVVFTPSTDAPPSLLVTTGSRERVRTSIAAGRHARAHATQAAAGPQEGLILRSGVPEIDDGLLWLRSRLAAQARRATSPDPGLGLAAIGVGDRDAGERLLSIGETTSAGHALLAARLASVLGDTGPAARVAEHWRRHGSPEAHPLTPLAARSLAEALDHVSHPDLIAGLRAMGAARRPPAIGERRLPTVGGDRTTEVGDEHWWQDLLSGDPSPPVPSDPRRAVVEARESCARFVTDPDGAWATWRRLLSSRSDQGDAPTTRWDPLPDAGPVEARPDDAGESSLTAELLLAVVHGLLGIRADAAVGRLRLAPRLPSHVRAFGVEGIPLGSSDLRMDYRRDGGVQTFELLPGRAAVPPLVIFEPSVPGVVEEVRVDGEPAELEMAVADGRTTIAVQLPVDRPRTLEIRT